MQENKGGRRGLFRVAALVVAPLLLMVVALSGTANAAWRSGEMYNLAKAQCLDGGGGWVSTWSCNGSAVQIWNDITAHAGTVYQLDDNNGQCLDGGQGSGLYGCIVNDTYQQWTVQKKLTTSDGRTFYQFHSVQNGGLCLDGGQSHKSMWFPCNGGNYQLWSWN